MKNLLIILLLFITAPLFSQKQANVWYFGNGAGLNFNDGVKVMTNGQVRTRFGTSCIADSQSGILLFYTDGKTVWNGLNQIIPNGEGLSGFEGATQPALIVPKPGNKERYYIFTIKGGSEYALEYSEVNVNGVNNTIEVVPSVKNKFLTTNIRPKLTATRHANGRDYWLVTQILNSNRFQVFLLSPKGISQPRTYAVGATMDVGNWNQEGYMKFSIDGRRLAHVMNGNVLQVDIFNFDNNSGKISRDPIVIDGFDVPFGVEFSPNGRFVYISELNSGSWPFPQFGGISQYDLTSSDVSSTRTVLVSNEIIGYGSLQLGPDGRIYCGKENGPSDGMDHIAVIEQPNNKAPDCGFNDNGIYLNGKKTRIGLPAFVPSLIPTSLDFDIADECGESCRLFTPTISGEYDEIRWEIIPQAGGKAFTSEVTGLEHKFKESGIYDVKLKVKFPYGWDSISKPVDIALLTYSRFNLPETIDGRKIIKQATVSITSPQLDLFVWDQQKEDGDRISLIINGKWVLTDYTVKSEKQKFSIDLNPDSDNYLILYAHNLGEDPPNTAAVSYFDGEFERSLTLKSDMHKCGAIRFVFE